MSADIVMLAVFLTPWLLIVIGIARSGKPHARKVTALEADLDAALARRKAARPDRQRAAWQGKSRRAP